MALEVHRLVGRRRLRPPSGWPLAYR